MPKYRVFVLNQANGTEAMHDHTCSKPDLAIDVAQMLFSGKFPPDKFQYIAQKQEEPKPEPVRLSKKKRRRLKER